MTIVRIVEQVFRLACNDEFVDYLDTIFGDKDFRQSLFLDSFGEHGHSRTL